MVEGKKSRRFLVAHNATDLNAIEQGTHIEHTQIDADRVDIGPPALAFYVCGHIVRAFAAGQWFSVELLSGDGP